MYLNDFHGVNAFARLFGDEASNASILHLQTGMFLTDQLQELHEVLIHQHVLQHISNDRKHMLCPF